MWPRHDISPAIAKALRQFGLHILVVASGIFSSVCLAQSTAPERLTLRASIDRAVATSERLKRGEQEVRAAEARYQQAVSALFPTVALNGGQHYRSSDDFGRVQGGNSSDPSSPTEENNSGGRSIGSSQFETVFTVQQPIFTGFREQIRAEALLKEKEANELFRTRDAQLLSLDVAQVFFQVALYESDLRVLESSEKVLLERITDLKQFQSLGKARESEGLASQSELADLYTLRERTAGLRLASKELLAFLIATPALQFEVDATDSPLRVSTLDGYLEKVPRRADVEATKLNTESRAQTVLETERERWPQVSLEGAAYPYEDPDRNRDWEVLLRMDLNIFDAGRITARVAERTAELESAKLTAEERLRIAEREVRVAWSEHTTSSQEVARLKELLEAATKNYQVQKIDYADGVVTNLEVLAAIRQMQDAERRLRAAEIIRESNARKILVAAGESL